MSDHERSPASRARRPAGPSDEQAYVPPVPVPPNDDAARRTREVARVHISPEVDSRRRPTVRRVPVTGPRGTVRIALGVPVDVITRDVLPSSLRPAFTPAEIARVRGSDARPARGLA